MKYLFITLAVQDGERRHDHRCLHTTNAKNIEFAAQRYAASFWGFGERQNKEDDFWWVNGEITIRLTSVIELSKSEYKLMSDIFSGNVREIHPTNKEIQEFKTAWGQTHKDLCEELGYNKKTSDDIIMLDFFWIAKDKKWYNKEASGFTPREQLIADYLRHKES